MVDEAENRKIPNGVKVIITVVILLCVGAGARYFLNWYLLHWKPKDFIHEIIRDGEGYGFAIGEDKVTAYERAKESFAGRSVEVFFDNNGRVRFLGFQDELTRDLLMEDDIWDFSFNGDTFDGLRLFFQDGKLTQILRSRGKYELP